MRDPLTTQPRFPNPFFQRRATIRIDKRILLLAFAFSFCTSGHAQERVCTIIPAGQEFWIRLSEPVSTYSSKRGAPVQAILIDSPRCHNIPVFPVGVPVEGRITYLRRVGMGVRHASSAVTIDFDKIFAAPTPLVVEAQIEEVANGREDVKRGVIQGVGGRETPQSIMTTRLLHLPFWNAESYWIFLVRRAVFPFSPEPEIYLPPGTDLRLRLTAPLEVPSGLLPAREVEAAEDDANIDAELAEKLLFLPKRSSTRAGKPSDVVNLAFLASAEQIGQAFQAAGWTYGDSVSAWSVLHEMRALSILNSYSHLPISNQWLGGKGPDLALQKSFDSYQKREHIRFWNEDVLEPDLWVSGAIRETGATWSFRRRRFIHHVEADVDAEREKVVRDLSVAGCVANVYRVQRARTPERLKNASGDVLRTDGGIAVVRLKDCEAAPDLFAASDVELPARPQSKLKRFVRAQALSIHDLWRSNVIYASFDLSFMFVHSLRNRSLENRRLREYRAQKHDMTAGPALLGTN